MKEERLSVSPQELDLYIAKAKKLRAQEMSRISSRFFHLPIRLFRRAASRTEDVSNLDTPRIHHSV